MPTFIPYNTITNSVTEGNIVVTLSASHFLQNSPKFTVQGFEVWTPREPILDADEAQKVPP